jgi:predicted transcriptional regulator
MVRPIALRSDRGLVERRLRTTLQSRFETLKAFGKLLSQEDILEEVTTDDALFASIIYLSINEYGLSQANLARELGASAAAVGRWALVGEPQPRKAGRLNSLDRRGSLPPAYSRRTIVEKIAHLLNSSIEDQEELKLRFPRGRIL